MEQSGKNISDYAEVFYRRKWILIIPTLLFAVAAAAIAYRMPSYYRSSTLIIIEGQQIPEAYVKPTDLTPLSSRLSTLSQQIMSRTRLEKIATDFNLYNGDPAEEAPSGLIGKFFTRSGNGGLSGREAVIEQMRKDVEVKVIAGGRGGVNDADAFTVSYISQNPYVAMQVTNTLASLFIEENLKIREQYAEGTSEFLVSELEKAKLELEEQEKALRDFKERHMGSLPEQIDANLRTLDRLQVDLQAVTASIKNTEDKIRFLDEQLGVGPGGAANTLSSLEIELQTLRKDLDSLLSIYKENYPDVIIAKNRIKEVEARLKEERAREALSENSGEPEPSSLANPAVYSDLMAAKSDLTTLKKRETDIRKQIKMYERRVEVTPANEQRLSDIKRDSDISLQNYRSLLEKKLSARLAENLEKRQKGERFRIIDPANLPARPFKPDRRKILGQGALAGVGLGAALVLLFEFLNPAFRRPEDFGEILPFPLLSTIPRFAARSGETQSRRFLVVKGRK